MPRSSSSKKPVVRHIPRRRRLELALDDLADRFGGDVVLRAGDLALPRGVMLAANLDFLDDRA
jgi:hypothetical protein